MSTHTANALADALTEAMEEALAGLDTTPIEESVMDDMRCNGEFVTADDLSGSVEEHVDNYIQNSDLMERYQVEQYVTDEVESHLYDSPHHTIEEIEELVAEYVARRSLKACLSSLFDKIRLAFRVRLTLRRG